MSFDTLDMVAGYRVIEQIYSGGRTLVYKAIRKQDQQPVILKLMRNPFPSFSEIAQFRNQYSILKDLNIPGIVQVYSLEPHGNGYVLVMEDFGGIPLNEAIAQWRNANQNQEHEFIGYFFHIALQIVTILELLNRDRIIHKDIKPDNILVNPDTAEVKIIDFSIASRLPREIKTLSNPNVLEGTLAYIAPEQTGRMNRGIDYRSDFYSLGVTLFEFLCGQLPFTSNDSMELVHCHIAKAPPKVSSINPRMPAILSDIISKLMAKNAEDRYQSCVGLKHDLEFCFLQWKELQNIVDFPLGEKDISDRFTIPEKLYGRQKQVEQLLAAFDWVADGNVEMLMVAGYSGVGKTALVNEVHKPIIKQRGYFIKGKFDQFQRDIPFSALVQAFRNLIEQLLSETDTQVKQWKNKILWALGKQGQIIIDVIPELEIIIGTQPAVAELSGSAAQNRFNLLFQKFIQVFTTVEHPLVMFLDDLQWADAASLNFIQLLMNSYQLGNDNYPADNNVQGDLTNQNTSLLLIGAYRDNEVSQAHPLHITLEEIRKTATNIQTITLEPLNQENLNCLLQDVLHCTDNVAAPLTKMVFNKTKGNPFFVNQLLKSFYENKVIRFDYDTYRWCYDIEEIKALTLTDDVVEFMAMQIQRLPKNTQEVLKLAACIGNLFDLKTLSIIYQQSEIDTAADLWHSLLEGLVIPENDNYKLLQAEEINSDTINQNYLAQSNPDIIRYKFIHDRVQQAAYFLISEDEKQEFHLRIGQLLLQGTSKAELENRIFDVVNQLNIAVDLITVQEERDELASMNLTAGSKALAATAYQAAINYLNTGIQLLADDSWESKYNLTLSLYETAAEVAYVSGDFQQTEKWIEVVLGNVQTLLDKVKIYEVKIQAYGAQNRVRDAVDTALIILKDLGIEFPKNPRESDVGQAIGELSAKLGNRSVNELLELPPMTAAKPLAQMRILSCAIAFVYHADPQLIPLICLQQIKLSLEYGNASLSAFAYVGYGLILCGVIGDIESGYQWGKLAEKLLSKFDNKEVSVKVIETFNQFIRSWKEDTRKTLKPLLDVYATGLETGDLEFAAYAMYVYSYHAYYVGQNLTDLEQELGRYSNAIKQIKQDRIECWNEIYRQIILNLQGNLQESLLLIGTAYDEEKMLPIHLETNDAFGIFTIYLCKLQLCYLLADFPQAIENASKAENYLQVATGMLFTAQFHFYDSLARLAVYLNSSESGRSQILEKVQVNQDKMQHWANHAPMNYLHKFELVEAEKHRVLGNYLEAMEMYDRAIAGAKENEYTHEEALANELAGKFYLEWGKQNIAQAYLTEAYYGYSRWGAKAKIDDLAQRYPQLLTLVIQQENLRINGYPNKTTTQNINTNTLSDRLISSIENRQTIFTSRSIVSNSLDLAGAIKASQTLSGEIDMEQLLSNLMSIMMENAGASKCTLMLQENDTLKYTAVSFSTTSTTPKVEFPNIPLDWSKDIPLTLINQVKHKLEIVVIDDVSRETALVKDSYIKREQPESILCMPIMNQGEFIGILYLENNFTTGAFTYDRIEFLKLITTQAAISLKNATLYQKLSQAKEKLEEYSHSLEEKVEERTEELYTKNQRLQQALQELQTTQTQLIQSEKMSSLGQMVAGIAHEINNPINFIHGNIDHASEYIEDLLDLVSVYQQEYNDSSELVAEKVEEVDLDFLAEDLPKLLNSMRVGTSRIRSIVLSLRNFSRLDEAEMKSVDIHEGIDNSLMILQHRLKAKNDRQEIEVIKEYDQLPEVNCYPGQLNQVFMNILSNAIDALEEQIMGEDSQLKHLQIRISTELMEDSTVKIRIADNGSGIPEEVQEKIFDPFFTTKPVGSGTGLGLSISYQIIVDKHKGQLNCSAVPGEGTEFMIMIPV